MAELDPAARSGAKREELLAANSMILQELDFSSLGTGGSKPGAKLASQIENEAGAA